jgi:general nucleoside transport system permease protein
MQKIRSFFLKQQTIFVVMIALLLSLVIVGLLLVATGRNPFAALSYFVSGAFGTAYSTADTLTRMIPLAISGVAFLIGAQTGVFNVGIEGQLLLGAMASALVGWLVKAPAIIAIPLMLLSGALAGGLYALIAAWLKAYRGINEILSTIMLNYPAFFFTHFLVLRVFPSDSIVPSTPLIQKAAELPIILQGTKLHAGLFVAILVSIFAYLLLQKTTLGYEMRAVGKNKEAARYHGVPVEKRMVLSFFLSGAVAGLAGAVEIAGMYHHFLDQFSPGYGYDAITVALVALLNPFGVLISGTLFGALKTGIMDMSIYAAIPRQLATLINGIVVLFIAGKNMIESGYIRFIKGREHYFDISSNLGKEKK